MLSALLYDSMYMSNDMIFSLSILNATPCALFPNAEDLRNLLGIEALGDILFFLQGKRVLGSCFHSSSWKDNSKLFSVVKSSAQTDATKLPSCPFRCTLGFNFAQLTVAS